MNTALPRGDRRSDCRCRAFAALPWYQPLSEDLGHEGVHHLGRLPLYIVGDVGVGVQGEAGLGVAKNAGKGLGVHPGGQGVGSEGVPQIMESKAGQFGLFQQLLKSSVCASWVHRPPRAERIWEEPLGQGSLLSFPQKLGGAVGEQDRPLSCIGLSLPHCQLPALTGADGAAYLERPGLPVEVLPPEPAQLPPPQAGGQLRVEEVVPDRVELNCAQEFLQLVVGKYPLGCVGHAGRSRFFRRIERD